MMGLGANFTFTEEKGENGEAIRRVLDGGENPPAGVIIYYTLPNPTKKSPTNELSPSSPGSTALSGTCATPMPSG